MSKLKSGQNLFATFRTTAEHGDITSAKVSTENRWLDIWLKVEDLPSRSMYNAFIPGMKILVSRLLRFKHYRRYINISVSST